MRVYRCPFTDNSVTVNKEGDMAELFFMIDYEHMTPFFVLLRITVDRLTNEGVKIVRHSLSRFDWDIIDNKEDGSWSIIDSRSDENNYMLECSVETCLFNFGVLFDATV